MSLPAGRLTVVQPGLVATGICWQPVTGDPLLNRLTDPP